MKILRIISAALILCLGTATALLAYKLGVVDVSDPDTCSCEVQIVANLPKDEPISEWDGYAATNTFNDAGVLYFAPDAVTIPAGCGISPYSDTCDEGPVPSCDGDTIVVVLYALTLFGFEPLASYGPILDQRTLKLSFSSISIAINGPSELCGGKDYDFQVIAKQGNNDISNDAVTTASINGVVVDTGYGGYPSLSLPSVAKKTTVVFNAYASGCGCVSGTGESSATIDPSGCPTPVPSKPPVNPDCDSCPWP
jgi:hypothetical protein